MLKIECIIPVSLSETSKYVLNILGDRLNIVFQVQSKKVNFYSFIYNDKKLNLPADFALKESGNWLKKRCQFEYSLNSDQFYGKKYFHIPCDKSLYIEDDLQFYGDIIGTLFIILSRYEEHILTAEHFDDLDRFKADSSFSFNQLSVPVADDLVDLLDLLLTKHLDVNVKKRILTYKVSPSHDVDRPFEYLYYTKPHLLKRLGGDLLVRKSGNAFLKRFKKYREVKNGNLEKDPYNTFNWLMNQSEENSIKSTFYFLASITDSKYDHDYKLENREIQDLLLEINKRGHSIGLHPSFSASEIEGQVCKEYKILKETCEKIGIKQNVNKSRYHYLRWNNKSITELEKAGIISDETLTYAEKPGFRCGTCKPYPSFNFDTMKTSSVIIEPLILMEKSLFSSSYMSLLNRMEDAWDIVSDLKSKCKAQNGNFTLLWHNNYFESQELKEFYKACIQ